MLSSMPAHAAVTKCFWYILKTAGASNLRIYYNIALDSLYISTGDDVIIYFRSAANRINGFIFGHVQVAISR